MKYLMQALTSICKLYECEVELIQPWHARVTYFGKPLFDYFPKNARLHDLKEKHIKRGWYTLNRNDWKDDIHRILSTFIWTNIIYPNKKDSDKYGGIWEDIKKELKEKYSPSN